MTTYSCIKCQLPSATKLAFRTVAKRQNVSQSTLIKRLIASTVQGVIDEKPIPESSQEITKEPDTRVNIRLSPIDRRLLAERATARGLASSTYVSLLVRSHLHGVAPLPKEELKAIRECLRELALMRRYAQALAQLAVKNGQPTGPHSKEVIAMVKILETVHGRTKSLLASNLKSWETGDGSK